MITKDKCLQMKFVEDGDYRKLWTSTEPMKDSDWPIWFILKLDYMDECLSESEMKEFGGKYCVNIEAVAPKALSERTFLDALRSMNMKYDDLLNGYNDQYLPIIVADYGCKANLFTKVGNNMNKLLKEAREELQKIRGLFSFYMDRPQNRIGNSGWDFIRGEIGFGCVS